MHYPRPVHLQVAYADLGYSIGDFPVSERLASETMSLPIYPELTEPAVRSVCDAFRCILRYSMSKPMPPESVVRRGRKEAKLGASLTDLTLSIATALRRDNRSRRRHHTQYVVSTDL